MARLHCGVEIIIILRVHCTVQIIITHRLHPTEITQHCHGMHKLHHPSEDYAELLFTQHFHV